MAKDNEIIIKIRSESDGTVKASIQETDKLTKATEGATGAKKKGTQAGKKFHKQEKALYQGNLSSAKGFSKMKETIGGGGSSSLVAAYATLAANVFAATAAFNALRGAAQVQTLVQGFEVLANVSGRTSSVIAENLREIAQGALSMEEALRASALAISSGFSTAQLQELTQVATNASVALGRNLGDSVDRLIRGVAKLEPEILDELGIMVRLDTAVENYAATIGKSATALTDFERRQAFLNESIDQGQRKFGMMKDEVELSPFEKLGATFTDLANNVLGAMTSLFGPLLKIVASSQTAMMGLLIMFGSGILTTMIPALGNLAGRQAERAHQLRTNASLELKDAEAMRVSAKAALEKGKASLSGRKGKMELSELGDKASIKAYKSELNKTSRDITTMENNKKKYGKAETKRRKQHIADLKEYKRELDNIIRKEEARAKLLKKGGKAERSIIGGDASSRASERIGAAGGGMSGSWQGMKIANEEFGKYRKEMNATTGVTDMLSKKSGMFGGIMRTLGKGFIFGGTAVRIFGAALINAIPFIGQIIFVISLLINGLMKLFGASTKYKKAQEALNTVIESVPAKMEQMNKTQAKLAKTLYAQTGGLDALALAGHKMTAQLEIMAGMTDEFMTAQADLNSVIAEEGVSLLYAFWAGVGDVISMALDSVKEFFGTIKTWIAESAFGKWFKENFSDIGSYDEVIRKTVDSTKSWREAMEEIDDTGGVLNIALKAQKKAFADMAKTATEEWKDVLVKSGGDVAKAYELAEKKGISITDATAYLGTVTKASSVEVNRQVKAVTTLGQTFAEAGKKLNMLNAATAKKNKYRELSDQFTTLKDQIVEANKVMADEEGGMIAVLKKLEGEIGETEKKLLMLIGGVGTLDQKIITAANAIALLASKEEEYASEKKMLKAFTALEKAITKAEVAMVSYRAKLEGLQKTGKFAMTAEGELNTAFAIAAIKLSTAERERDIKLMMIRLEYDLLEMKLRHNTDLHEKEKYFDDENVERERLVWTEQGKELDKLTKLAREAAIGTINATAEAAKTGILSTIAAARAGAGQKGTTVERIQALTKKRIDPEVLAAEREKAMKAREVYMKAYNDPKTSAKDREVLKGAADAVITDIDKIEARLLEAGKGTAILGSGTFKENINQLRGALSPMLEDLKKLGPEGELVASMMTGSLSIADSFHTITDATRTAADKLAAVANIIGSIGAIMAASSKAKIAAIDKEIAAEKKKDGKSASSLMKIKNMEKKKEVMAKKAFEQNKKMQIASAIISTAAAVVGALAWDPKGIWNVPLAIMIGAMGLAQVAIIKKQQFEGGAGEGAAAAPSKIEVGKRENKINVAKRASAGELAYIRGERGMGTSATNFVPTGGAAGLRRSYAAGGFLVGEQGPEVIQARGGGYNVIANDDIAGLAATNVNFTINTIDSQGVEDFLITNQGSLIHTIRQAANAHGEDFLETIDSDSVGGG